MRILSSEEISGDSAGLATNVNLATRVLITDIDQAGQNHVISLVDSATPTVLASFSLPGGKSMVIQKNARERLYSDDNSSIRFTKVST